MRIFKPHFFSLLLVFLPLLASSQQKKIDSLRHIYFSNAPDSTKLDALNALIWPLYSNSVPDSGIKYGHIAVRIGEKNKLLSKLTVTYRRLAICYTNITDFKQALFYHQKSLTLARQLDRTKDIGIALGNIGVVYQDLGDQTKALDYNLQCIRFLEKAGDTYSVSNNYYNIGLIYKDMGESGKALEAMRKCIHNARASGNNNALGVGYNGMGIIFKVKKEYDSAAWYYRKGILTNIEGGNLYNLSEAYVNYGSYFTELKQYDSAIVYLNKSLKIATDINLKGEAANALANLAFCSIKKGQYKTGISQALQSLRLLPEDLGNKAYCYEILMEAYGSTGDYENAMKATVIKYATEDSLRKMNVSKDLIKLNLQFEYDKKAAADSIRFHEQKKISEAKVDAATSRLRMEKTVRYALVIGLFILLVFSYFIFTRFRLIKKQNIIIDNQQKETQKQKALLEEKQKEIIDSINYANRIQRALLATDTLLKQNLGSYFIFFNPKAIVSGDFYWASKLSDGRFTFVTADCTGHGVPGAFMSLLNISFLNEAINERLLTDPGKILDLVRMRVIEALSEDGSMEGGKDGMDCNIVVYDFKTNTIEYAAAHNPVWICRGKEIIELKADKMPVGKHDKDSVPFSTHSFSLQKDDLVYTFTDGYADQFGGPKGKKFKYKQLYQLLTDNSTLSLVQQRELLYKTFSDWKGELEQIDDVCVVGIQIN
ncbi:MAG: protein serine/threonine phosphatase [Bacteroidetes bacterium]|jgi:serine phosphatase RsbU (regulator of sigma subunit)/tetratricopeptide (TPR) repeat protein|nr:protein serine/threonine phosphatase [Bacteroidota bacterium]